MMLLLLALSAFASAATRSNAGVYVHLFEWRWDDIARECEEWLGPKGYTGIQISPPQEHAVLAGDGYPWWQRYQQVSHLLDKSRSGTYAQLVEMVQRCKAVGVEIYADVVWQHTTGGQSGYGSAGSPYNGATLTYPTWSSLDFHGCSGCPSSCDIQDYYDAWEVQYCRLVGLRDLETGDQNYVQVKIAEYFDELGAAGVAGLRMDGCKHAPSDHIKQILSKTKTDFFIYQEVIYGSGQPITPEQYVGNGRVTEFRYGLSLSNEVRNNGLHWLVTFGQSWGMLPDNDAMAFIDNHDNQRGHGGGGGVLTHKDGLKYSIANIFMLAWPYGYPQVMSSYYFSDSEAGPPSDSNGNTYNVDCFNTWVCEHRWTEIANMVKFRKYAGTAPVTNWWTNGASHISFSRGTSAFLALSTYTNQPSTSYLAKLPRGLYCNVIQGETDGTGGCENNASQIYVGEDGWATFSLGGRSIPAVAIHIGPESYLGLNVTLSAM